MEPSRLALVLSPLAAVACSAGPRSPSAPTLAVPTGAAPNAAAPAASGGNPVSGTDAGAPASGAPLPRTPLIHNVYARATRSLDGAWRTIVDPYENGYYDYRYQLQTDGY